MLCAKLSRTRSDRNTRSWAFHGSYKKVQQGTVKSCDGKRAEGKQHVVQCVHGNRLERDEATKLFQF